MKQHGLSGSLLCTDHRHYPDRREQAKSQGTLSLGVKAGTFKFPRQKGEPQRNRIRAAFWSNRGSRVGSRWFNKITRRVNKL